MDDPDGSLAAKARVDLTTAALRSLIESGHLDRAPRWLRDEVTEAAMALATIVTATNKGAAIAVGERALERARAWLIGTNGGR